MRHQYSAPPVEGINQKIVGIGDYREPLLREGADFNINVPSLILRHLHNNFEGDQAGGWVDFLMGAHPGRTIHDAFL